MTVTTIAKMPEPPDQTRATPQAAAVTPQEEEQTQDLTVYFLPKSASETRGLGDSIGLSLADFSEHVVGAMERFNAHYQWEVEIEGEIKIGGVFGGTATLKISPK
jgi:Na+-translocating ferredoxin:NAD+ oxidoreductase RnfG subunit